MSTHEPTNQELLEMVNRRKQADAEFRRMYLNDLWNDIQNIVQRLIEQALANAGVRWASDKISQTVKWVMDKLKGN
jgi:hypothetical protein